jgi:hypothetical protein
MLSLNDNHVYKFDEKRAITPRWVIRFTQLCCQGRIQEGAHPVRANPLPLKLEKKLIFWPKIMIFHTKYPKHFRAKPDFFPKIIVKSFLDRFKKNYTKIFGIVYILLIEIQTDPAPQPDQPDWYTCTYCREMPEGEKVCCKEDSERCHSRMPVNIIFFICLYYSVA